MIGESKLKEDMEISDAVNEIMSLGMYEAYRILNDVTEKRKGAKSLLDSSTEYTAPAILEMRQDRFKYYDKFVNSLELRLGVVNDLPFK